MTSKREALVMFSFKIPFKYVCDKVIKNYLVEPILLQLSISFCQSELNKDKNKQKT